MKAEQVFVRRNKACSLLGITGKTINMDRHVPAAYHPNLRSSDIDVEFDRDSDKSRKRVIRLRHVPSVPSETSEASKSDISDRSDNAFPNCDFELSNDLRGVDA
jgi:hypothetical protein